MSYRPTNSRHTIAAVVDKFFLFHILTSFGFSICKNGNEVGVVIDVLGVYIQVISLLVVNT